MCDLSADPGFGISWGGARVTKLYLSIAWLAVAAAVLSMRCLGANLSFLGVQLARL